MPVYIENLWKPRGVQRYLKDQNATRPIDRDRYRSGPMRDCTSASDICKTTWKEVMVDSPDEIRRTDTSHHLDSSVVQREERLRFAASRVFVYIFGYRIFPQNTLSRFELVPSFLARCAQKCAFSRESPARIATTPFYISLQACLRGNGRRWRGIS